VLAGSNTFGTHAAPWAMPAAAADHAGH
jgi:hypothetical protein